MNPDPIARYLQRLPTFVTFFFSIMLVSVFNKLSTLFNWSTGPTYDFRNLSHDLTAVSFLATLFFVVSVWLSYSLLIERFPYTLDYKTFIFDVVRFSVLFMIFSFAFLAGIPPHYWYYLAGLGVFHLLMAGWHSYRLRSIQGEERIERAGDIRGHLLRMGIYFVLAIIYYVFVAIPWNTSQPWGLQAVMVVITSTLLVYMNVRRLSEVKIKAQQAQEAAKALQAQEAAKAQPATAPVR
jgi:hypothetical protein